MSPVDKSVYSFYFNGSVREIIPIYPLYAVMFSENGITPLEISTLFVIWALVGIVFEVPSGALADRFSRKWLIVSSGVLKAFGFLSWFLWQDFYGFAFGFVLWGLGSTFRSGAFEALLYDTLATNDRQSTFTTHYGRISAIGTIGVVIGELSGGILISQGYDIVLLASAIAPLIASIPVMLFVKDVTGEPEASASGYLETLRAGLAESVSNRVILYILLASSFLLVIFGIYDEYVGLVLRDKQFSLSMIAFLGVPILLAQSAGQALAPWFARLTLGRILLMIAISSSTLLLFPFLGGLVIPALLALYFFIFGLAGVLFQGYLQSNITGNARATVTSVVGLGDSFGAILWFFLFGAMAEVTNVIDASFGLGSLAILLCALFYLLAVRWRIVLRPRQPDRFVSPQGH